jgi:hypothetical protein
MAFIDDRHDLVGRKVFAAGKQGMRNFKALVGWIDPVRAQLAGQIFSDVLQ